MIKTILSTADVARLFNVTETTVKRWADEGTLRCQKTPGGHRKFEIRSLVEFAERNDFTPVGTITLPHEDALGRSIQVAILGRDFPALVRAFVELALSADQADFSEFLCYLYEHRIHLWEIYDLVVCPGMREIGERWIRNEIGVNHEHRASYETLDALARLQSEIRRKPSSGRNAMFACLGNEAHEIGLRCTAYLFESEGWSVLYLGARTPPGALIDAIQERKPRVVCISMTSGAPVEDTPAAIKEIRDAAHAAGGRLILGGQGCARELVDGHLCDATFHGTRDALNYISIMNHAGDAGNNNGIH